MYRWGKISFRLLLNFQDFFMSVRVRIAPSPTGDPHVGTAYMALFNYVFAKKFGGKFILRIEDTDQTRSRPDYEKNIYEALKWCNIQWDEGPDVGGPHAPYRQSERYDIYRKYCQILLDSKKAYKCFATPQELAEMRMQEAKTHSKIGYDRRYRDLSDEEVESRIKAGQSYVVRLKVPLSGECIIEDGIKGRCIYPWADVDDQVLLKSDGFPTYHLANVVDDHLMQITHVIRGDEWLSSTPKHLYLYEAFGFTAPKFMHMPLLLGKDGKKLSKRRNPTSIFYFRDSGYLPEAFMNFLSLMGYSMPHDLELYSLDNLINEFDPNRIGVSGAVFDILKLDWINQQYIINNIPEDKLWDKIKNWQFNEAFMKKLIPLVHKRIKTFSQFMEVCDFFFIDHIPLRLDLLCPKHINNHQSASILQAIIWNMDDIENWTRSGIEESSRKVCEVFGVNHKKAVMPILFATIMGKTSGPSLFDSVDLLGKDRTRIRLLRAIEFLGGISGKMTDKLKDAWQSGNGKAFMESLVHQNQ
jgi:glutamyl-tRNA synthetase